MASIKFNENSFNLDNFRANFLNGARNYLFYVIPNFPSGVGTSGTGPAIRPTYLVKSSSIPARVVSDVVVNWQGYNYPLGGKSTIADWSITFTVDKECTLYTQYVKWIDYIHDPKTNVHGDPVNYAVDQSVQLLSLDGKKAITDIEILGCWPTSLSELALDYASSEILNFTVTFKVLRVEYK